MTILEVIKKHRLILSNDSNSLPAFCTSQSLWTARHNDELVADLKAAGVEYKTFTCKAQGHPDFGQRCIEFRGYDKELINL